MTLEEASQRTRGMRDLLPEEASRLRRTEDAFIATCRAWGYREIRTPAIEPLHLFTSAGTLSPHTLETVYSFLDWDGWSGERVVLRPDSTIPAARLYAEHFAPGEIAKLFYTQTVYRFTEDGSDREEGQCGVELMGDTGLRGDIELILLARAVLAAAGVERTTLTLSHAGVARAVLQAAGLTGEEQIVAYDRLLDGDLSVVGEIERGLPQINAPLRMLFEIEGAGTPFISNLRAPLVSAIPALAAPFDDLEFIAAALEAMGETPIIKAVLARNFEYYSGAVFRMEAGGNRVAAGGRYDELIGLVSSHPVPASGFALYTTRAASVAPAATDGNGRITVVPDGDEPDSVAGAYRTAEALRARGFAVDTAGEAAGAVLRCGADPLQLTLSSTAGDTVHATIDDVIRALQDS